MNRVFSCPAANFLDEWLMNVPPPRLQFAFADQAERKPVRPPQGGAGEVGGLGAFHATAGVLHWLLQAPMSIVWPMPSGQPGSLPSGS